MRVTPASDPGQSSNAAPARKKAGGNCFLPAFSAQRPTRAPRKPSRQWREMIRKGPGAVHFSGSRMHFRSARGSVQAARSADGPRLRRRARARISLRSLRRLRRLQPPTKPRFDSALVGASRSRAARTDRGSGVAPEPESVCDRCVACGACGLPQSPVSTRRLWERPGRAQRGRTEVQSWLLP